MAVAPDAGGPSRLIVLLVLAFATYGYFQMPSAWNQNSRFDLTRSIVERRAFDIDPYHQNTGDKAFHDGHYYSDKAPGTALLAVPSYALYYGYLRVTGASLPAQHEVTGDAGTVKVNRPYLGALFLCSFLSVALVSALALLAFFRVARRLATDAGAALLATLAFGFGSLAFPYATLFYGHALCGALLIVTFALLVEQQLDGDWQPRRAFLAGLAVGFAVLTEYPAVIPAGLLFGYACLGSRSRRVAGWFVLGGSIPMLILAGYLTVCFGAPWHTGYGYVNNPEFAGMHQGLMGLTYPRPRVIFEILVGTWRGLLPMCPVLAVGGFGLYLMYRDGRRREALLCAGCVGFFLLLNSSYYMWWGGSSLGPRHMVPGLGFLALGIARLRKDVTRTIAWVLLAYSVLTMLVCTAVGPEPPIYDDPMLGYYWHRFLAGQLAINPGSSNFGSRLGLPGLWSLLPLLAVWAAGSYYLVRREPAGQPAPAPAR